MFLVRSRKYFDLFNIPKLYNNNIWGIVFVGHFVVCTPYSISDMTATEFYLRVVTHDWNWWLEMIAEITSIRKLFKEIKVG